LKSHGFPGNVRELINMVKQAVAMCERRHLDDYLIQLTQPSPAPAIRPKTHDTGTGLVQALEAMEKDLLLQAADQCRTTRKAAAFLKISQPTVVRKFKKYGIAIHL
jgi:DNA-binding NtrC family response regulator